MAKKENDKQTNNSTHNTTQKTKDLATRTNLQQLYINTNVKHNLLQDKNTSFRYTEDVLLSFKITNSVMSDRVS